MLAVWNGWAGVYVSPRRAMITQLKRGACACMSARVDSILWLYSHTYVGHRLSVCLLVGIRESTHTKGRKEGGNIKRWFCSTS